MRILVTNDDGPPSKESSPYIHSLVSRLQHAGHEISVVIPRTQRSWSGQAHIANQELTPTYYRPGALYQNGEETREVPFSDGLEQWILLDAPPASCVQAGFCYHGWDAFDLVLSGPNKGQNTTARFASYSGTLGAAREGSMMDVKSIALSFHFDSKDRNLIENVSPSRMRKLVAGATDRSIQLIEKLYREWPKDKSLMVYNINMPLCDDVESRKLVHTHMTQNQRCRVRMLSVAPAATNNSGPRIREGEIKDEDAANSGRRKVLDRREHVKFLWSPDFSEVQKFSEDKGDGDGWHILQKHITVTPLYMDHSHLPWSTSVIKRVATKWYHPWRDVLTRCTGDEQMNVKERVQDWVKPFDRTIAKRRSGGPIRERLTARSASIGLLKAF